MIDRYSTGYDWLDDALGGGLIPGTLTVVYGATGVGKTHLGVSFAAGEGQENRGMILDLSARGDSQDHALYANRLAGWKPIHFNIEEMDGSDIWDDVFNPGDYVSLFMERRRRVTRSQMDDVQWHDWNIYIQKVIHWTTLYFYSRFATGKTRVVVDGLEPVEMSLDSAQMELFDYLNEQVFHSEAQSVAREALRHKYYESRNKAVSHNYDHHKIASLALLTSSESMLDEMIRKPVEEGGLFAVANTLIYMGRVMEEGRISKALFIAKHRGSYCSDDIIPFKIDESGLSK